MGNNPIINVDPFGLKTCEKKCNDYYRMRVAVCGLQFEASCWYGNPIGGAIKWMLCMRKARAKHMKCYAECAYE